MKVKYIIEELDHNDLVCLFSMEAGGFEYWGTTYPDEGIYTKTKALMQTEDAWKDQEICYEDVLAEMVLRGNKLQLIDSEEGDVYTVGLADIKKGFEQNMAERPWDMDLENGDANTGDCIMQFACFGEIVFG